MNQAQKTCQINTIIETETENEQQAAASMQYIAFSIQLKYISLSDLRVTHILSSLICMCITDMKYL